MSSRTISPAPARNSIQIIVLAPPGIPSDRGDLVPPGDELADDPGSLPERGGV
jgi:hypothetical protein